VSLIPDTNTGIYVNPINYGIFCVTDKRHAISGLDSCCYWVPGAIGLSWKWVSGELKMINPVVSELI
jgi:hypothetical protein